MFEIAPKKIVIFDYSGTLSIEAPRFARPENLVRALSGTGLASLGIATPEVFWGEIVAPTWTEGSTTAVGYRKVMADRIRALRLAPGVLETEIDAACTRFVDRYLAHSRIDPHWRPLLSRLTATPENCGIVATDHYAEATEAILGFLQACEIRAGKAGTAPCSPPYSLPSDEASAAIMDKSKNRDLSPFLKTGDRSLFPLFVANSADLGFWKADRRFWEILRSRLNPGGVKRILIVDDFGFNEEAGDSYGQREKVLARQEKTAGFLREVFHAEVEVIPFFLEGAERDSPESWSSRIEETADRIRRFLENRGTATHFGSGK